MARGQFKLTERSDGTFYLQCRCGETGQPCRYQGEVVNLTQGGMTLERQAKQEAFEHCWSEHKIPAWALSFDISYYHAPSHVPADAKPFLVTTEPQKTEARIEQKEKANG
jgi:hypothetical protein